MNGDAFSQIDRIIHEKGRLAIMSTLATQPEVSFIELRELLGMTDGNLTTHIKTLQQAGYIAVTKSYRDSRPLTTCALTPGGRAAFAGYIELLEQIVKQAKNP